MTLSVWKWRTLLAIPGALMALAGISLSQGQEDFEAVRKRMEQAKPGIQKRHADLLEQIRTKEAASAVHHIHQITHHIPIHGKHNNRKNTITKQYHSMIILRYCDV